ncbi:hypothetical protein CCHR01_17806 [Colletotrichum chrysophilum]|uniref:Uncharacterized protein n=1 Tax=Colletotrichum chrysophilum TaxID=1836956 RepID=A0AAD9A1G8_9PEZI|nr:hypothetical protein CCHR01_17806 [Colletotrichum chrysophilum]
MGMFHSQARRWDISTRLFSHVAPHPAGSVIYALFLTETKLDRWASCAAWVERCKYQGQFRNPRQSVQAPRSSLDVLKASESARPTSDLDSDAPAHKDGACGMLQWSRAGSFMTLVTETRSTGMDSRSCREVLRRHISRPSDSETRPEVERAAFPPSGYSQAKEQIWPRGGRVPKPQRIRRPTTGPIGNNLCDAKRTSFSIVSNRRLGPTATRSALSDTDKSEFARNRLRVLRRKPMVTAPPYWTIASDHSPPITSCPSVISSPTSSVPHRSTLRHQREIAIVRQPICR